MSKITLNNNDKMGVIRSGINSNFSDLYNESVFTTGNQTISGVKTFTDDLYVRPDEVGISVLHVESGMVGINNETPSASLDVSGSVKFSERPLVNSTGILLSGDAIQPASVNYRGNYSNQLFYTSGDVVFYAQDGLLYKAVSASSDEPPRDSEDYWILFDAEIGSPAYDLYIEHALSRKQPLGSYSQPGHTHSASEISTGTLDVARIPVLPSQKQVVGNLLSNLSQSQQLDIGQGTVVTTSDGRRWVYTGSGSKTSESSYIVLADITPEWSAIANKPVLPELALKNLPDSQANLIVYIDDASQDFDVDFSNSQNNGKNVYSGNGIIVAWSGSAWILDYNGPYGVLQFLGSGGNYPWEAVWDNDSGSVAVRKAEGGNSPLPKSLNQEASTGTSARAAREDHVHPLPALNQIFKNVPTSPAGLPSGSVWIDTSAGNVLKIVI